jgi:hypothetical protein
MAEPITDPLILQHLNRKYGAPPAAESEGTPVTDPMVLQHLERKYGSKTGGGDIGKLIKGEPLPGRTEMLKDVGTQAGYGFTQGLVALPNLAYRGIDWLGEKATGGDFLPNIEDSPTYKALHDEAPEAQTTAGRYAHRVGEFAGGAVLPGGGLYKAAKAFPEVWGLRALGRTSPGKAAAVEGMAALGGGAAAQTAEELDYGPWGQVGAGMLGGIAAPSVGIPALTKIGRGFGMMGESGAVPLWRQQIPGMPARPEPLPPPPAVSRQSIPEIEKLGRQQIADKAMEAGIPPGGLTHAVETGDWSHVFHSQGAAPRAEMLADIDPQLARLAGGEMRAHGEASRIGQSRMTARQTGETPALGLDTDAGLTTYAKGDPNLLAYRTGVDVPAAGQQARAIETMNRAALIQDMAQHGHGETAEATARAISARQAEKSATEYGKVRAIGDNVNLQGERGVQAVVDALAAEVQRLGPTTTRGQAVARVLKEMAPNGKVHSHIDDLDKAKQVIDERVRLAFKEGSGSTNRIVGREMSQARTKIINAVDKVKKGGLGDQYNLARAQHGDEAELLNQLQLGDDLFHGKADIADYLALAGDRDAMKRVRHGFVGAVQRELDAKGAGYNVARIFDNKAKQRVLRDMLSNTPGAAGDQADRFMAYLNSLGKEHTTRHVAYGGSQTAERQADDKLSDTLHRFRDIFSQGGGAIPARAAEYLLNKTFGQRAQVASSIVNDLTSADPIRNRAAAAHIEMLMGRGRAGRFADLLEAAMARHGQKAVGAAPGSFGIAAEYK